MHPTVRIFTANVRQYAAKKRAATDVRPSRSTKKSQVNSESKPMRETDILSVVIPNAELVIALSAPIMLPPSNVPSVEVESTRDGNVAAIILAVAETTPILVSSAGG